jgi:hypothetical protein
MIFAWLVLHNRLSTRERLANKGVISEATCPFGCNTKENLAHLLFHCPHTSSVWNKLNSECAGFTNHAGGNHKQQKHGSSAGQGMGPQSSLQVPGTYG